MGRSIYVQALVRAPMDALWAHTQQPDSHERWDLRFGSITRVGGPDGGPQRFRYATRLLPGVTVAGTGCNVGERWRSDGGRTSALTFRSAHPLSLIAEGSGYWRYVPQDDAVRFLTGYDYRPRWGRAGVVVDGLVLRPLMGWATAWSFDRLRLWLERGLSPERTRNQALLELVVRGIVVALAIAAAPALGMAATVAVVVLPPLPGTPAARRCVRRPPPTLRAPRVHADLSGQESR